MFEAILVLGVLWWLIGGSETKVSVGSFKAELKVPEFPVEELRRKKLSGE